MFGNHLLLPIAQQFAGVRAALINRRRVHQIVERPRARQQSEKRTLARIEHIEVTLQARGNVVGDDALVTRHDDTRRKRHHLANGRFERGNVRFAVPVPGPERGEVNIEREEHAIGWLEEADMIHRVAGRMHRDEFHRAEIEGMPIGKGMRGQRGLEIHRRADERTPFAGVLAPGESLAEQLHVAEGIGGVLRRVERHAVELPVERGVIGMTVRGDDHIHARQRVEGARTAPGINQRARRALDQKTVRKGEPSVVLAGDKVEPRDNFNQIHSGSSGWCFRLI